MSGLHNPYEQAMNGFLSTSYKMFWMAHVIGVPVRAPSSGMRKNFLMDR
jgi:hypothetical protein